MDVKRKNVLYVECRTGIQRSSRTVTYEQSCAPKRTAQAKVYRLNPLRVNGRSKRMSLPSNSIDGTRSTVYELSTQYQSLFFYISLSNLLCLTHTLIILYYLKIYLLELYLIFWIASKIIHIIFIYENCEYFFFLTSYYFYYYNFIWNYFIIIIPVLLVSTTI